VRFSAGSFTQPSIPLAPQILRPNPGSSPVLAARPGDTITIIWNYAPESPLAPLHWPIWLSAPFLILQWGSWLFSQVFRYRRVSSPIERQQTKWVVFAVVIFSLTLGVITLIGTFVPGFNLMTVTLRQQVSYFAAHERTHLSQIEAMIR
jgi:hypothetical protein